MFSPIASRRESDASVDDQSAVEASLPGSPTNVEASPMRSAEPSSVSSSRTSKASPAKRVDIDVDDDNEKFSFFRNMTDSRDKKDKRSPTKVSLDRHFQALGHLPWATG